MVTQNLESSAAICNALVDRDNVTKLESKGVNVNSFKDVRNDSYQGCVMADAIETPGYGGYGLDGKFRSIFELSS